MGSCSGAMIGWVQVYNSLHSAIRQAMQSTLPLTKRDINQANIYEIYLIRSDITRFRSTWVWACFKMTCSVPLARFVLCFQSSFQVVQFVLE